MPECCDYFSTNNHATAFPGPHISVRVAFVMCVIVLVDDFTHLSHSITMTKTYCTVISQNTKASGHMCTRTQTYVPTANILMAGLTHNNLILIHPDCHDMQT